MIEIKSRLIHLQIIGNAIYDVDADKFKENRFLVDWYRYGPGKEDKVLVKVTEYPKSSRDFSGQTKGGFLMDSFGTELLVKEDYATLEHRIAERIINHRWVEVN